MVCAWTVVSKGKAGYAQLGRPAAVVLSQLWFHRWDKVAVVVPLHALSSWHVLRARLKRFLSCIARCSGNKTCCCSWMLFEVEVDKCRAMWHVGMIARLFCDWGISWLAILLAVPSDVAMR
jgi:hypothetical protein